MRSNANTCISTNTPPLATLHILILPLTLSAVVHPLTHSLCLQGQPNAAIDAEKHQQHQQQRDFYYYGAPGGALRTAEIADTEGAQGSQRAASQPPRPGTGEGRRRGGDAVARYRDGTLRPGQAIAAAARP